MVMIGEYWILEDYNGIGGGLVEVTVQNLPSGTEETTKNAGEDCQCPGREMVLQRRFVQC
jgi:hypothetical protein